MLKREDIERAIQLGNVRDSNPRLMCFGGALDGKTVPLLGALMRVPDVSLGEHSYKLAYFADDWRYYRVYVSETLTDSEALEKFKERQTAICPWLVNL